MLEKGWGKRAKQEEVLGAAVAGEALQGAGEEEATLTGSSE